MKRRLYIQTSDERCKSSWFDVDWGLVVYFCTQQQNCITEITSMLDLGPEFTRPACRVAQQQSDWMPADVDQ